MYNPIIKSYVSSMNDNRLDLENDVRAAEYSLTRSSFKITEIVYMERYNFEK